MKTDPCDYCDFVGPFVCDEQPVRDLHRSWHDLMRTCTRAFAPLMAALGNPEPAKERVRQVHAEYSVPYADTMAAARQELEAEGYTQLEVSTDQGGHVVLVASVDTPRMVEDQLYDLDTENASGIRATWSPVDGIRANHPWLGTDGTRYRDDYVIHARPVPDADAPEPDATLVRLERELAAERSAHERRSALYQGLAKWAVEQRDRADTAEERLEKLQRTATCPHGATAEELCNRLPSDAELAEMRAAQAEVGRLRSAAAREKIRADAAEAEVHGVWEQIGYPDPDRRPYNQTLAGAVASAIGYVEARLARVNGPAVSDVLGTPAPIEAIVQAVVALAHGPMMALDGGGEPA